MPSFKTSLDTLAGQLANIALSINSGGHKDPENDIAGKLRNFKGSFNAFVQSFSNKNTGILTSVAIEEFLRQLTHLN